jgi:hypothetical protein
LNAIWQLKKHPVSWAILFFGTGVNLPAKAIVVEKKRTIAALITFIVCPHKT